MTFDNINQFLNKVAPLAGINNKELDLLLTPKKILHTKIKVNNQELITAFGQACAYLLFSHKAYIVNPKNSGEDISRLESLCLISGIGLVLFDNTSIQNPHFEIKTRPSKHEPDIFYTNKFMKMIEDELF